MSTIFYYITTSKGTMNHKSVLSLLHQHLLPHCLTQAVYAFSWSIASHAPTQASTLPPGQAPLLLDPPLAGLLLLLPPVFLVDPVRVAGLLLGFGFFVFLLGDPCLLGTSAAWLDDLFSEVFPAPPDLPLINGLFLGGLLFMNPCGWSGNGLVLSSSGISI